MHTPSPRVRRLMAYAVVPVSVAVAAALISQSSYGAFSATTRNSGNNWRTGSVSLTDDDLGAAQFHVLNMVPGQTETKCIKVTSFSSVPGTIKVYLINPIHSPQHLENYIHVTINQGDGGGFNSCTGFVPTAAINPIVDGTMEAGMAYAVDYAHGAGSWVTLGVSTGESKTYQVTWTFDVTGLSQSALDGLQGASTGLDAQWELQNN